MCRATRRPAWRWRLTCACATWSNSLGFVADTSQRAADTFFPFYAAAMNTVGRERGWAPIGRAEFDAMRGPEGALVVGSPQEGIKVHAHLCGEIPK